MARTKQEIKDQIIQQKNNAPELTGLNSVSNTAIWNLWVDLTVTVIFLFERLLDLFKADIQSIINSNQYGTDQWWYNQVKGYQHGDLLVFLNNVFQYAVINPSKQIIKFCSITSQGGKVQVKVATSASGQPAVLDANQINGLIDYLEEIRPSGVQFVVQSLQADILKIYLNVYYNASADITIVKPAVEAAIMAYLENLNTTQFDGTLYVNRLIDAIQAVTGVVNDQVEVLSISAKNGADPYQAFTSRYQPKSGYFNIDPDYPLEVTINYLT